MRLESPVLGRAAAFGWLPAAVTGRALPGRLHRAVREFGWRAALRLVLENLATVAGPGAPGRLRRRHLARDAARFDRRHGTDTAGFIDWGSADLGAYEGSDEESFEWIMRWLALPFEEFTFLDIGCGKGKSTLLAARHPFREVVGVERAGELCAVARRNLEGWPRRTVSVRIVNDDATRLKPPDGPLLVYLFNPFGARALHRFLERLESVGETDRRPIVIAYYHARHAAVLERTPWLEALAPERLLLHGGFRAWGNRLFVETYGER